MLSGYKIDNNGIIEQIDKTHSITYDKNYSSTYDRLGELSNYMSYLRYGFIVGTLQRRISSILDIGYGNCAFLKVCNSVIPICHGYDISDYPILEGCVKVDSINQMFYDVITLFDSLEHFKELNFLNKLNCNYVVISVPECHYYNDEWLLNWKHRKPNEHLWHFNRKSLENLLKFYQFELVSFSNIEDTIRKSKNIDSNILTGIFKKLL